MQAIGATAPTRLARTASVSGFTPARRVEPKATSVAVWSVSSFLARAKNSTSLGLRPVQPPSMKVTPRWSSCSATRNLSSTVSERPSCWLPSRRMVSKMSTASGRSGTAKSCAWALWPCACVCRTPSWLWAPSPSPSPSTSPSVDMVEPFLVLVDLAAHGGEVGLLNLLGDLSRAPGADGAVVDGADRHDLGGGAGQEGFVGQVQVGADDGLVADLVAEVVGDGLDRVLRDAVQRAGVGSGRREEHAVAHDEDVLAGALADVTVGSEQ